MNGVSEREVEIVFPFPEKERGIQRVPGRRTNDAHQAFRSPNPAAPSSLERRRHPIFCSVLVGAESRFLGRSFDDEELVVWVMLYLI